MTLVLNIYNVYFEVIRQRFSLGCPSSWVVCPTSGTVGLGSHSRRASCYSHYRIAGRSVSWLASPLRWHCPRRAAYRTCCSGRCNPSAGTWHSTLYFVAHSRPVCWAREPPDRHAEPYSRQGIRRPSYPARCQGSADIQVSMVSIRGFITLSRTANSP